MIHSNWPRERRSVILTGFHCTYQGVLFFDDLYYEVICSIKRLEFKTTLLLLDSNRYVRSLTCSRIIVELNYKFYYIILYLNRLFPIFNFLQENNYNYCFFGILVAGIPYYLCLAVKI